MLVYDVLKYHICIWYLVFCIIFYCACGLVWAAHNLNISWIESEKDGGEREKIQLWMWMWIWMCAAYVCTCIALMSYTYTTVYTRLCSISINKYIVHIVNYYIFDFILYSVQQQACIALRLHSYIYSENNQLKLGVALISNRLRKNINRKHCNWMHVQWTY